MIVTDSLTSLLNNALNKLDVSLTDAVQLEHPGDPTHGDYASNAAMIAFSQLQKAGQTVAYQSPRQLAEALVSTIRESLQNDPNAMVSDVQVAGPGFINFTLSEHYLMSAMNQVVTARGEVVAPKNQGKQVVVEYSSPNIAKPFTIGHLRSTIIGDAVAHLLEATGWKVFRDNHLGDWGTQFGKQIYAIKTWGDEAVLDASAQPVKDLVELYVKFHEEAEKNPALEDEGRAWFKRLEDGDPEARRLWTKCIEWSLKEFRRIYTLLNVSFTENEGKGYGESFFEDKMPAAIAELEKQGLLKESEGAKLVFFPNDQYPPMMIIKKDGTTLYATRDLATDQFRLQHYGQDIVIINEVGAEQALYFNQLYKIEELLGWVKPGQRIHVKHGLYRFKDKKMSTRKGNVIWLEEVLHEAFSRVKAQSKTQLPDSEIWKIAIGAVRWNDLKREAIKDVVFDYDEITSIQGNSGPYIQYTQVRCQSVLGKAETAIASEIDTILSSKDYLESEYRPNQEEKDLLRKLYQYSEIVELAANELAPHYVTTYLNDLAQAYNTFYHQHTVLPKDLDWAVASSTRTQAVFRLALTKAVSYVLAHGLKVLGIETVEKM